MESNDDKRAEENLQNAPLFTGEKSNSFLKNLEKRRWAILFMFSLFT